MLGRQCFMHRRPLITVSRVRLETRMAYWRQGAKLSSREHCQYAVLTGGLYPLPALSRVVNPAVTEPTRLFPGDHDSTPSDSPPGKKTFACGEGWDTAQWEQWLLSIHSALGLMSFFTFLVLRTELRALGMGGRLFAIWDIAPALRLTTAHFFFFLNRQDGGIIKEAESYLLHCFQQRVYSERLRNAAPRQDFS